MVTCKDVAILPVTIAGTGVVVVEGSPFRSRGTSNELSEVTEVKGQMQADYKMHMNEINERMNAQRNKNVTNFAMQATHII